MDPNAVPIPEAWCKVVSAILRSGKNVRTIPKTDFDWEATFPEESWDYIRFSALADALDQPGVLGRHITDMREPGEVYAFWFYHRNRKLYAKINLMPGNQVILVISSHVPLKGETRL